MTPFEIDILFWYYTRGGDTTVASNNPPVWVETRNWFLREKLLEDTNGEGDSSYRITERGRFWCEYVCNLPLPTSKWVMP